MAIGEEALKIDRGRGEEKKRREEEEEGRPGYIDEGTFQEIDEWGWHP
jgi:hypothetical protein